MAATLRALVVSPDRFFADGDERPSLVGPALVAGVLGGALVVQLLILVELLGGVTDQFQGSGLVYAVGELAVEAPEDLAAVAGFLAVMFAVGWVLSAAIIYAVSRYFDPDGSFRRLLAYVGWGQVPTLGPVTLSTAFIVYAAATAPDLTSQAAAETWAQSEFVENSARLALEAVKPVFAVWTAYLWLVATEHALGLTRRQALVCVALPATVVILESLGGILSLVAA